MNEGRLDDVVGGFRLCVLANYETAVSIIITYECLKEYFGFEMLADMLVEDEDIRLE